MSSMVQKLMIYHTNDIHSFFEQMPKLASALDALRGRHSPDHVLTIDCGDHMDRMRMETEGSDGEVNIEVMNATGYDVAILGNNEGLTVTKPVLSRLYRDRPTFAVIGSNMFDFEEGTIPDWMLPYLVMNKAGLRIGMIGVTAAFTDFYELLGWDVRDPFQTVSSLVKQLRADTDMIIVLSHLGINYDKRLADEIEGIDLILGGHTHHLLEHPLRIKDTYLCATGKFGRYLGEVEVDFDLSAHRVAWVEGRCIDVAGYPDSPEIAGRIERYREQCRVKLGRAVAHLDAPLFNEWRRESALGNLLAAGIRKWTESEIGLVNAGQILRGLPAGPVTWSTLLDICPSPINPCRLRLTGADLRTALEEALLDEFIELPIRGFGFRGEILGTLCLDGVRVEFDNARPNYEKITRVQVNGKELERDREYRVGTIDMFTFGIGYLSIHKGRDIRYYLPEFIRDVLRKQLTDAEEIGRSREPRWIGNR